MVKEMVVDKSLCAVISLLHTISFKSSSIINLPLSAMIFTLWLKTANDKKKKIIVIGLFFDIFSLFLYKRY